MKWAAGVWACHIIVKQLLTKTSKLHSWFPAAWLIHHSETSPQPGWKSKLAPTGLSSYSNCYVYPKKMKDTNTKNKQKKKQKASPEEVLHFVRGIKRKTWQFVTLAAAGKRETGEEFNPLRSWHEYARAAVGLSKHFWRVSFFQLSVVLLKC